MLDLLSPAISRPEATARSLKPSLLSTFRPRSWHLPYYSLVVLSTHHIGRLPVRKHHFRAPQLYLEDHRSIFQFAIFLLGWVPKYQTFPFPLILFYSTFLVCCQGAARFWSCSSLQIVCSPFQNLFHKQHSLTLLSIAPSCPILLPVIIISSSIPILFFLLPNISPFHYLHSYFSESGILLVRWLSAWLESFLTF